jgi:hypothetical protein
MDVIELSQPIHRRAMADIHNPLRFVQSRTTDFVSVESYPHDRAHMSVIERPRQTARHRTIFISDIHLGTRGCQAELLLDFLKRNECDHLYLVGDIVDGWRLKRWWYWPQAQNDVVQKILRKARKGSNVIYIPGNHDEAARQYCQLTFGDVRVERRRSTSSPTAGSCWSSTATSSTASSATRWLAILGTGPTTPRCA